MLHNSKKLSIIFFGSSKYSVIDEQALFEKYGLSLVVTTPDQKDKKGNLVPNPVKKFAQDHSIPVITTDKITEGNVEEIAQYHPDFLVSADIRLILPEELLTIPKISALNVHHSLLPKFRGPAPVPFAILSGDSTTGVSIILIAKKVDAGDILAQETYGMRPNDTTDSVLTKLNQLGGHLAVKVIQNFDGYFKNRTVQNEKEATYSHYMIRQDGYIDINDKGLRINDKVLDRKIRAYFPWPGVWFVTSVKGKAVRVKLLPSSSHPELDSGPFPFLIQVEGKNPMSLQDFINGYSEGESILRKLNLFVSPTM